MSRGPSEDGLRLGPPERWLECPRKGQLVENRFLPFKTPLCAAYDEQVPEMFRFHPKMVFDIIQSEKQQIGLWIDLTNTERFYASSEVELEGARYVKLKLRGHGESPSAENAATFVELCKDFWRQPGNARKVVAVHCTHGFNRTGFLIAAFLCTARDWDVGAAIARFAAARPPGIYKQAYIEDLCARYGDPEDPPPKAPPLPQWSNADSLALGDDEVATTSTSDDAPAAPFKDVPFFDGHVPAVTIVRDAARRQALQAKLRNICGWTKRGFPGGQPVSMDTKNGWELKKQEYRVSWKADGVRYMLLIEGPDNVWAFDRDNTVYHVPNLAFPDRRTGEHLRETLLDGEMVLDKDKGRSFPRFLVYDIVLLNGRKVGEEDFNERLNYIFKEIWWAREEAKKAGRIDVAKEPFSLRQKDFFPIQKTKDLIGPAFEAKMGHETDGLIFQPVKQPYLCGRTQNVLKWKPPHLNSVDFKLVLRVEQKVGMLKETIGELHVLHQDGYFGLLLPPITKEIRALNGKIVECTFDLKRRGWLFLRERVDKSFPNALSTAEGVYESIVNPVTQEDLLKLIYEWILKPAKAEAGDKRKANGSSVKASMPPPPSFKAPQPPPRHA